MIPPDMESGKVLKMLRARFLASLEMTVRRGFCANRLALPLQTRGEKSVAGNKRDIEI